MTRRKALYVAVLMLGCGRRERDLKTLLPQQIEGGWSRRDVQPLDASDLPSDVTGMPWKQAVIARYGAQNGGEINVRLIEFTSETVAFELMQRWRQSEGLAFYKGAYFIVCRPDGTDAERLRAFTRSLQSALQQQG
jgi:hypothetical protein